MVIQERADGLVDENKLNKSEMKAFIIFMETERKRHMIDIVNIDKTLAKIKKKHNM